MGSSAEDEEGKVQDKQSDAEPHKSAQELTASDRSDSTPTEHPLNDTALSTSSTLETPSPASAGAAGPSTTSNAQAPTSSPAAKPSTPAKRRPKPPTKGILKPPPPPAKPTLTNRLRDIAGAAKSLFDPLDDPSYTAGSNGPDTATTATPPSVSSALTAFSGRLGLGLSRLVQSQSSPATPQGSPLGSRSISLPETGSGTGSGSGTAHTPEKVRKKQPLRRATFVLPSLSITYPISSTGEPWSEKVIEERKKIESTHRSLVSASTGREYWTAAKLVVLYESACRGREERPRPAIVRALEHLPPAPRPRHLHLTLRPADPAQPAASSSAHTLDAPLDRHAAESLADVLLAEWGLTDLKLEDGAVETEEALRPILHALLISGTLPSLSLSGNRKIRSGGWRLLAVFLKRARSLRFLDLSETTWDRKGAEYLVRALNCEPISQGETEKSAETSPVMQGLGEDASNGNDDEKRDCYGQFVPSAPLLKEKDGPELPAALQTLRMDGCGLRANVLEALATGLRTSDVRNVSLRRNRIGPLGGVALALMIRDYPDSAVSISTLAPSLNTSGAPNGPQLTQSTYSAYTPRSRKSLTATIEDDKSLPPIPNVISSPAGGITSRTMPEGYKPLPPQSSQDRPALGLDGRTSSNDGGASMAIQRSVRALDGVERIGRLLTLDLKSNDLKNGAGYIAQVLKRNRTLKVLNLSDNKIDPLGLMALAEALKYNTVLETLDVGSNPCCGPGNEGIAALRTTFTVNTSLKRLFLSDTNLSTEGAISLAEFLPETKSLLHLDLTANPLVSTAGVLALSVGLKSNIVIRCLDLSIPPNTPDLAELSQSILQSCIRNTELAAESVKLKSNAAAADTIWQPIKKSMLVKDVKAAESARADKEREELAKSIEGKAREYAYTLKPERVLPVVQDTISAMERWYDAGEVWRTKKGFRDGSGWEPGQLPTIDFDVLYERAKALRERVVEQIQDYGSETSSSTIETEVGETESDRLERLLSVNDELTSLLDRGVRFTPPPRVLLPSQIVNPAFGTGSNTSSNIGSGPGLTVNTSNNPATPLHRSLRRHMRVTSLEISSPNFSIGDSDNDSDAEELEVVPMAGVSRSGSAGSSSRLAAVAGDASEQGVVIDDNPNPGLGFMPAAGPSPAPHCRLQPFVTHQSGSGSVGEVDLTDELSLAMMEESYAHSHSPVEKASRAWVEEEGEIFRKGTKLGVVDDEGEEGEGVEGVSGEELKIEILETHVERSPTRRVLSVEDDGEEDQGQGEHKDQEPIG